MPKSFLPNPGTLLSNAELAVNGTAGPRFNISLFRTCTCISILVFLIASLISKNDIINYRVSSIWCLSGVEMKGADFGSGVGAMKLFDRG